MISDPHFLQIVIIILLISLVLLILSLFLSFRKNRAVKLHNKIRDSHKDALNSVLLEGFSAETEQEAGERCLAISEYITESEAGFIYSKNTKGNYDVIAVSQNSHFLCKMDKSEILNKLSNMTLAGIRKKAIDEGSCLIINDFKTDSDALPLPEGHLPVENLLVVPLKIAHETIGLIAVANRKGGYSDSELNLVQDLSYAFTEVLLNKKYENALLESEEKFRVLAETSPIGILMYQDEKWIYANQPVMDVTGYTLDELLSFNYWDFVHPDFIEIVKDTAKKRVSGKIASRNYEFKIVKKDGSERWIYLSGSTTTFNKKTAGIITVLDITKTKRGQKKLQQRNEELQAAMEELEATNEEFEAQNEELLRSQNDLAEKEEQYRAIFESVLDGIIIVDPSSTIVEVNPATTKIFGYSRKELIGMSIRNLVYPDAYNDFYMFMQIRESELYSAYSTGMNSKGDKISVQVLATNFSYGGRRHLIALTRDITELKKKDEQLLQSQKMETIGKLAGGLAHDFNNILGGIMGSINLLEMILQKEKIKDTEKANLYIETAMKASERAADIIKKLLMVSRQHEPRFTGIDLKSSIEHVTTICRNSFPKEVEIKTYLPETTAVAEADSGYIEQGLLNILVNASHALTIMKKDGENIGGIIRIYLQDFTPDESFIIRHSGAILRKYWMIKVEDNGVGMDKETKSMIFEPFFTTKGKESGTGLGLTMLYNVVTNHSGFIEVDSTPGIGTVFRLYFPASDLMEILEKNSISRKSSLKVQGTILVIDDEDSVRTVARGILTEKGYTVLEAENGAKGMSIYNENFEKIDLVLLDMSMPVMSGEKTYEELKKINPSVKVLLSSGFGMDDRVINLKSQGIDDFIEKPFIAAELTEKVAMILC